MSNFSGVGTPSYGPTAVSGVGPMPNYSGLNYQQVGGSGNCGGGCGRGCGAKCGRPYDYSPGLLTRDPFPQIGRAYGRPLFGRWCGY